MKNLNELLNEIRENEIRENEMFYCSENLLYSDGYLTRLILDDINEWLEEETEKQNYFEEKFRK